MCRNLLVVFPAVALFAAISVPIAGGYIHFPPMTLQKMCKDSWHIRVLKIEKLDKGKGVIVFENVEALKTQKTGINSLKHVVSTDAEGVKPVLDWAAKGKRAVMFSAEDKDSPPKLGVGYVFIDKYCYSIDYNTRGEFWLLLRGDPGMSACYYGSVEQLQTLVKDILDGKEVKVPVKEPETKEEFKERYKKINDLLEKNRKP